MEEFPPVLSFHLALSPKKPPSSLIESAEGHPTSPGGGCYPERQESWVTSRCEFRIFRQPGTGLCVMPGERGFSRFLAIRGERRFKRPFLPGAKDRENTGVLQPRR